MKYMAEVDPLELYTNSSIPLMMNWTPLDNEHLYTLVFLNFIYVWIYVPFLRKDQINVLTSFITIPKKTGQIAYII